VSSVSESKFVIYGLRCTCHPEDGIRYVGRTVLGARKRLVGHRADARAGSHLAVHSWMRKHGLENIIYEILEEFDSIDFLAEAESRWIESLSQSCSLMNLTVAVQGVHLHTEETKEKLRQINTGRFMSETHKQRIREAKKGKTLSEDHKKKIGDSIRGIKRSGETRSKMSKAQIGRVVSQETRLKISEAHKGRSAGEKNPNAKLRRSDVPHIIDLLSYGFYQYEVASMYGVTQSTIGKIWLGKSWST